MCCNVIVNRDVIVKRIPIKTIIMALAVVLVAAYMAINYIQSNSLSPASPTNNSRSIVPLSQIISGGPPPDGIPSIDQPKFVSAYNATFLSDSDTVIGINYNGEAKAYPLLILVWHEIVNDYVGGKPVSITYCPLCYSSLAFVRAINGTTVTFGTSGKLYNNNLVMYDRFTKSLWSEMLGEAIYGSLVGHKLQTLPVDVMTWGAWKKLYQNTLVLSENTGYSRPYGTDPYGSYYTTGGLYFPLNHSDSRLPTKSVVIGLPLNNSYRAYQIKIFNGTANVLADSMSNKNVVIFSYGPGLARFFNPVVNGRKLSFSYSNGNFTDSGTNSVWNYDGRAVSGPMLGNSLERYPTVTAFWFAWAAFYPSTTIYGYSGG